MATIKRQYKILPTLTKSNLDSKINQVFKHNASNMSKYGLSGAYCYAWVKNVLADLGIVQTSFDSINAWDFFAGLPSYNMKYFDKNFSENGNYENYPYHEVIFEKLAFIFGFFPKSKYISTSIEIIKKNDPTKEKITKLTELKRKGVNQEFQPITHIGIYANGLFYDFAGNKVRINAKSSFVPIAYYEFYSDLLYKLP